MIVEFTKIELKLPSKLLGKQKSNFMLLNYSMYTFFNITLSNFFSQSYLVNSDMNMPSQMILGFREKTDHLDVDVDHVIYSFYYFVASLPR